MATGYTRQSVASIVNGNVINASDFNNEYNALLAAFSASTGHIHDGTTVGGGAPIQAINGITYPASPATNTVPVVTSASTVTYEQVPNAALANSTVTIGVTPISLGATAGTINNVSLVNAQLGNAPGNGPTLGASMNITGFSLIGGGTGNISSCLLSNCTTSGTTTLGGGIIATGFSIVGGTLNGPTLAGTTSGTWDGSTTTTLTRFVLANPQFSGTSGGTIAGAGTLSISNCILNVCTTNGTTTLGGTLNAATNNITNANIVSPTITSPTITAGLLGNGAGTGCTLGASLNITGQSVIGGGTGLLSGCVLASNTTATTQTSTNNTTAVATTAFVQSQLNGSGAVSATANGYQIFPTGWTMLWGSATTNGSGVVTVSYPLLFGSLAGPAWSIQLTAASSATNATPKISLFYDTSNASGFRIRTFDSATGAVVAATVNWTAIGTI